MIDSVLSTLQPWLDMTLFEIRLQTYVLVMLSVIATFIIIRFIQVVVVSRLKAAAAATKTSIDDTFIEQIESIGSIFYLVLAVYIPLWYIQSSQQSIPDIIFMWVSAVTVCVSAFYVAKMSTAFVQYTASKLIEKRSGKITQADTSMLTLLSVAVKTVVWFVAFLFVFNLFEVDVTGLVAGLGVSGLVVAFSIQNVLADLFSSLSIYIDKPFKPGDFIIVGSMMGTVKKIGIKSTRISGLDGEEVVMSNKQLTDTEIHNYNHMRRRRIAFKIGVTYDTSPKKLAEIPEIIQTIIEAQDKATFDRCHIFKFDASSINAEIVYYVQSGDYTVFMDTQQAIVLGITAAFADKKIEFAFPTQTVHLTK